MNKLQRKTTYSMQCVHNIYLLQFTMWVDAVIFVFSLENEASFNSIYSYYTKLSHYRNSTDKDIPIILVGTQGIQCNFIFILTVKSARSPVYFLSRTKYYLTEIISLSF